MRDTMQALELARQAQAAAEVLWLRGDRDEALARAVSALETTLSVAPPSAALGPRPAALLRAAQLATRDAGAFSERAGLVLPVLRAQRRAERLIARSVESPGARRARRIRVAVGAWCVLVALASVALYRPHGLTAHATAVLARSDYFGASRAIDGDLKTAWLLPDRTLGALTIDLVPPRNLEALHLVQPEPAVPARGTTTARVRLYRGARAIAERHVSFLRMKPSLRPLQLPGRPATLPERAMMPRGMPAFEQQLEVALRGRGVTRVEIVVEAWRGTGGGLAEVVLR